MTNEDDENIEKDEITDSNNNNVSSCFENDDLIAFTNQDSDEAKSNDASKVIEQEHENNSMHSETTLASKNSGDDIVEDTDKL